LLNHGQAVTAMLPGEIPSFRKDEGLLVTLFPNSMNLLFDIFVFEKTGSNKWGLLSSFDFEEMGRLIRGWLLSLRTLCVTKK